MQPDQFLMTSDRIESLHKQIQHPLRLPLHLHLRLPLPLRLRLRLPLPTTPSLLPRPNCAENWYNMCWL